MSIKDSLIELYQNGGGTDPGVMESTTELVREVGNLLSGNSESDSGTGTPSPDEVYPFIET